MNDVFCILLVVAFSSLIRGYAYRGSLQRKPSQQIPAAKTT